MGTSNIKPFEHSRLYLDTLASEVGLEIWRPVKRWEKFYEISNLGRVRSMDRHLKLQNRSYKGMIRKSNLKNGTTPQINLKVSVTEQTFLIRDLVMKAFVGNPIEPNDKVLNLNKDLTDNRLCNLRYVTDEERHLKLYSRKKPKIGSDLPNAFKLNEDKVKEIKRRLMEGEAVKVLAAKYKVTLDCIYKIRNGTIWKHVDCS